ncbi:uncharacterized protein [Prorops nasuta]|uniref:uncharacterized protein n=1 Tax=Prorops nasuta TaxID=863751 RepID=UPI0034CEBC7F
MAETMKSWLLKRLGIIVDLRPDIFGNYTSDGTLLAQLLHSYGIINSQQLKTIVKTQDPALRRVNLKHLRIWLHFIGVTCSDRSITEISIGQGTTALQLFYKIYLSLEDKDRLDFITQEKEREKYIPTSRKFNVVPVPEGSLPCQVISKQNLFDSFFQNNTDSVDWYRYWFQQEGNSTTEVSIF